MESVRFRKTKSAFSVMIGMAMVTLRDESFPGNQLVRSSTDLFTQVCGIVYAGSASDWVKVPITLWLRLRLVSDAWLVRYRYGLDTSALV